MPLWGDLKPIYGGIQRRYNASWWSGSWIIYEWCWDDTEKSKYHYHCAAIEVERENVLRSRVQSKRFRFQMWQAVVLNNNSADRILIRSEILSAIDTTTNRLTLILAVNPGSPDNFTLNVGGRGCYSRKVNRTSRTEEISGVTYIGLFSMGESGW